MNLADSMEIVEHHHELNKQQQPETPLIKQVVSAQVIPGFEEEP